MNQNTRAHKLEILFAQYPKTDTFFLTSDDKAFFDNGSAGAHASTLKDKTVQSYNRKTVQADIELEKQIEKEKAKSKSEEEAQARAEAEAKAKAEAEKKAAEEAEAKAKAEAEKKAPATVEPTEAMTKEQLADWLNEQNVEFNLRDTKPVLLEAAQNKYKELTKISK